MAIEIIPNQPVFFDFVPASCNAGEFRYQQRIHPEDLTYFQFNNTLCDNAFENLDNPEFNNIGNWNVGAGWTIAAGLAIKVSSVAAPIGQISVLTQGKYYRLTIEATNVTGSFAVLNGFEILLTITSPGTYTEDFFSNGSDFNLIALGDSSGTFTSVSLLTYDTNYLIGIFDDNDIHVRTLDYRIEPEFFTLVGQSVTVVIAWSLLLIPDGCFYFCLTDPCNSEIAQNGLLNEDLDSDEQGWDLTLSIAGTIEITGGQAFYSTNNNSATGRFEHSTTFAQSGITYKVTWEILAITDITARFEIGSAVGAARSTPGVYIETITAVGTVFAFQGTSILFGGGLKSMSIGFVRVELDDGQDIVCEFKSNNFRFGSPDPAECSTKVIICNNSNSMGLVYEGTDFAPALRTNASFENLDDPYEDSATSYLDSEGRLIKSLGISRKQKALAFRKEPEPILDFLRLATAADNLVIDGVRYKASEDSFPAVRWRKTRLHADIDLAVELETQSSFKNPNTFEAKNIVTELLFLQDATTGEFIADAGTGQPITLYNA